MFIDKNMAASTGAMSAATAADGRGQGPRVAIAISVALAVFSVAIHLIIMRQFEALGVFTQYDVLFDADLNVRLDAISHSWPTAETIHPALLNSVHPYFAYYFGPVIRVLVKGLSFLGIFGQSEPALRVALGVLVIPIVSGLQTGAFCAVLFILRYRAHQVGLIAVLGIFSFSGLIFGSIPDHFQVTNLAVTLMLLLAAAAVAGRRTVRLRHWALVGAFATGITITNIVIFGIVHWSVGLIRRHSFWPTTARTFLLSLSIFAVVIVTAFALGKLHDVKPARTLSGGDFVLGFMNVDGPSLLDKFDRAVTAIGNAVAATDPDTREDGLIANEPIKFVFTLKTAPSIFSTANPLALLAFLGIALGGVFMLAKGGPCRSIAIISIAVLAFNIVFHSIWGEEHFLYSQHWITPALILFSGVFYVRPLKDRIVVAILGLYVIAVAVNNMSVVEGMIQQIAVATR